MTKTQTQEKIRDAFLIVLRLVQMWGFLIQRPRHAGSLYGERTKNLNTEFKKERNK